MSTFRIGDRVEWERRTADGARATRRGTAVEDSPGLLGFLRVRSDEPADDDYVDGTTCVRNELLRHAAPVGVRQAIADICGADGFIGPWRAEIMADDIIELLVRGGHLHQPQPPAPIMTLSIPGTVTALPEKEG